MSLTEIIEAVQTLSPDERKKIADVLDQTSNGKSVVERQKHLNSRLMAEGLLKHVPDRTRRDTTFKPIKIKGKPISETIIEERR